MVNHVGFSNNNMGYEGEDAIKRKNALIMTITLRQELPGVVKKVNNLISIKKIVRGKE